MYINLKERTNKKEIKVFYIYVCESNRVDGKVKNTQRYFGNIKEPVLLENDFSFLMEAMKEEKFTAKEIWLVEDKLKSKIEEILEEQNKE